MGKYYVAGIPFDSENSLKHYGVKGMEWDKHKFGLDADTRFIKWIDPNKLNVGSYGKYGKMAEAAAKQKYGANAPTPRGRLAPVYNKQSVMNSAKRAQQNMKRQQWNNSPIGKASNFIGGTANKAGQAIGTTANQAGRWAGQQAQKAGQAIGTAANQAGRWAGQQAQNIDQALNITGNKDRTDAERFREYANNTDSQFNKDYWNNRANESQSRADNSLAGKVTSAANQVGNFVNKQANDVYNTFNQAANQVGNFAAQQANNVANSAPVQAVGQFIDQNITGNTDRAAAQGYQQIAEDLADDHHAQKWEEAAKRAQERADNTLFGKVGQAANAVGGAANAAGQWIGDRASDVAGAAQGAARNVGNFVDQNITGNSAREMAPYVRNPERAQQSADNSLFGRVGNAVNAVGDWAGRTAQNVGTAVGGAADQARSGIGGFFDRVGNTVTGAANAVGGAVQGAGDWVGDRARDVGGFVDSQLNLSGNQAQAEADRYRNLSNQASSQTSKDYWDSKAAESQQNADNSLAGRAKGFLNSAGQWVSGAANNVSNAARDVGGAVSGAANKAKEGASGFINSAGQWVSNTAGKANQAAKNVGSAVSGTAGQVADFARNLPENADRARDFAARTVSDIANTAPGQAVSTAANAIGDWARNVPGNVSGAANDALRWVGGGLTNMSTTAERLRDNVGNFVSNLPGNVNNFVDQNITGNSARAEANRYNTFAQNPNMDSVQQLMNQRAAENAQARADNTLFGRVGNAVNAVGDWASNVPGQVSEFARSVPGNIAGTARNVGGAVSGAAGAVGDWARNVPGNVVGAANAVGDWAGQAAKTVANTPQNIANWYTGQPYADRASAIDSQVQNYERMGDLMYRQGMQDQGDRYHQLAANLGSVADANQARYEAAPQQRLSDAGQWIGDQAQGAIGQVSDWWNRRNPFVQHSAIDDKPDGVSDAFWEKFTADGGTREEYERDWR